MLRMVSLLALLAATPTLAQDLSLDPVEMSEEEWGTVRTFLETNPQLLVQIGEMMQMPSVNEQQMIDARNVEANRAALFEDPLTPIMGNEEGSVVIVKFSDYMCVHCRAMNERLNVVMENDPRVQVRLLELPILGPRSVDAARFALAVQNVAGKEAYEEVHDALFAQKMLGPAVLRSIAEEAGLDYAQIQEEMAKEELGTVLKNNLALAQEMGISGTPGFVMQEVVLRGALPQDVFERAIDDLYPADIYK